MDHRTISNGCRTLIYCLLMSAGATRASSGEPIGKLAWEVVSKTPTGYCPQGLTTDGERLLLSAYNNKGSVLFECNARTRKTVRLFALPADSTHASGLDLDPDRPHHLYSVDYDSNKVYLIDLHRSKKQRSCVLICEAPTGLKGTSACCLVHVPRKGRRLLVTDFRNSNRNICLRFDQHAKCFIREPEVGYTNHGYSQGATYYKGHVFESGNRILSSYVVLHRLQDSLDAAVLVQMRVWDGPGQGIEGVAILDGFLYTTDEHKSLLYRAPIDDVLSGIDGCNNGR